MKWSFVEHLLFMTYLQVTVPQRSKLNRLCSLSHQTTLCPAVSRDHFLPAVEGTGQGGNSDQESTVYILMSKRQRAYGFCFVNL